MSRWHAARGLAVAGLALVATAAAAERDALVAEGERWWTSSGDPRTPVACATCHHDPFETRGWAPSFPKFKPLPPPHGRVMTLLQANAEAVKRHYGHTDPRSVATAITAYLAAQAAGLPPTPGRTEGQPAFEARLRALGESVARGSRLYARRCAACHASAAVAPALAAFPRARGGRSESLEGFLEEHAGRERAPAWDSPAMADVIAYLAAELARRPSSSHAAKE
ncbi:MAG TPA: c-type cytochrome [Methylomirabilota bacterium]|nr:c-type cytochrome [Methylomirabilota bacterium]